MKFVQVEVLSLKSLEGEKCIDNEDKNWEFSLIISNINSLYNCIQQHFKLINATKTAQQVFWDPPTLPFIKLNNDGNSLANFGTSAFEG